MVINELSLGLNNKKYEIIIGSPIDYEELVAYIVIDGKHVALLSQEEGIEKIKIELGLPWREEYTIVIFMNILLLGPRILEDFMWTLPLL